VGARLLPDVCGDDIPASRGRDGPGHRAPLSVSLRRNRAPPSLSQRSNHLAFPKVRARGASRESRETIMARALIASSEPRRGGGVPGGGVNSDAPEGSGNPSGVPGLPLPRSQPR
jgi:hypothetical protein